MPNPEPPKADQLVKTPRTSWQNLRDMALKRELVCDNIDSVLNAYDHEKRMP